MTSPCPTPAPLGPDDGLQIIRGIDFIQLLGDCGEPGVWLALDYDYGDPQRVDASVAAVLLDGERVLNTRAGNRTITLPLVVRGTDRQNLTQRMDTLLLMVNRPGYVIQWTPLGGLPEQWDCFAAQPTIDWDIRLEDRYFVQQVSLVIPALPYGRNPGLEVVTLNSSPITASGVQVYTMADITGSARSPVSFELHFDDGGGPVLIS
jgi:hypothetical protein